MPGFTGSLRYPYEAITEKTDYLQIAIYHYDTSNQGNQNGLLSAQNFINQNAYSADAIAAGVTKNKVLGPGGVIMLPMPSNIQDSNSVSYEAGNMDKLTEAGLNIAQTAMSGSIFNPQEMAQVGTEMKTQVESMLNENTKNVVMKSLAASAINVFGANVSINSLLAREQGKILNPNMELLFNNVTLRTFRFSFKMTPRDRNESVSIKSIIRTLKKNMAAKSTGAGVNSGGESDTGMFLKTPNIFELQYMKGQKLHPFLNRFKPCVLSDMSVNYTGENVYATYGDGTPVSMILTLTFKELVPIYENDYNDDAFTSEYDASYNNDPIDDRLVYGVDGTAPNGVQKDVEGVGY